jgi:hypothetical protein
MKVRVYKNYICYRCGNELFNGQIKYVSGISSLKYPVIVQDIMYNSYTCSNNRCLDFNKWMKIDPEILELEEIKYNV